MGSRIENETEFGKKAYGNGVMFCHGELDTVPFSVTQLSCDDSESLKPVSSEAINNITLLLFLVQDLLAC